MNINFSSNHKPPNLDQLVYALYSPIPLLVYSTKFPPNPTCHNWFKDPSATNKIRKLSTMGHPISIMRTFISQKIQNLFRISSTSIQINNCLQISNSDLVNRG